MENQSFAKNFGIMSMASIASKFFSILYLPFLMYILGKEGIGLYTSTYVIFTFVYVIANSGISVAVSKMVSEFLAINQPNNAIRSFKVARFVMGVLGIVLFTILFFFALPLSKLVHFHKIYLSIKVLSPAILITPILSVYRGFFQGCGNMKPTAISQIMEQIINVFFSLIFSYLFIPYGIEMACAGATIGTSLGAFVALIFLIKTYKVNLKHIGPNYRLKTTNNQNYNFKFFINLILKNGLPITICLALQNAGAIIDMSNIKSRLSFAGFSDSQGTMLYGILSNYNTLINVPITIVSSLSIVLLPSVSKLFKLKAKDEIVKKIKNSLRLCFLITIPSAMGLSILSKPIYKMMFPKAQEGYTLMLYGSSVLIIWGIVLIQTTILQSIGKLYQTMVYTLLGITAKIIINYFLVSIPRINISGAIIGNVVCFIIPLIANHILIRKYFKITYSIYKSILRISISSVFMACNAYIIFYCLSKLLRLITSNSLISNDLATILTIIFGAYIYLYNLVVTKEITNVEFHYVPLRLRRFIPRLIKYKISY